MNDSASGLPWLTCEPPGSPDEAPSLPAMTAERTVLAAVLPPFAIRRPVIDELQLSLEVEGAQGGARGVVADAARLLARALEADRV